MTDPTFKYKHPNLFIGDGTEGTGAGVLYELKPDGSFVALVPCGFDFEAYLVAQREWSEVTFGPGPRPQQISDHIRKELREIKAAPLELEEWIDVAILALDGAWRAGHSPEAIIIQLVEKAKKNRTRRWPDWRTADTTKAIEHIRDPDDP